MSKDEAKVQKIQPSTENMKNTVMLCLDGSNL